MMAKDKEPPFTAHGVQYLPDKKRERGEYFKRTKRLSIRKTRSRSADNLRSRTKAGSPIHNGHIPHSDQSDRSLTSPTDSEVSQSVESTPVHQATTVRTTDDPESVTADNVTFSLPNDEEECDCSGLNNNRSHKDDTGLRLGNILDIGSLPEEPLDSNEWLKYEFPFENVVLSGGGSKGYAYIGALRALEDCGVLSRVRRVGGSSAGAICGGLLVVGCTPQEIADVFFCNVKWLFQDQKCSCCFFLPKMWKQFGVNPGARFSEIYGQHIARKVGNPDITFLELYRDYGKEFCVAVTNVSRMCSEYCHWTTTPDLPIRTAVRISMSFPVVYEAVKYNLFGQEHIYIDGGTLDQYPIHCFDGPQSELNHNRETGRNKAFNEKTVGVYLLSETPVDYKIWECLFGANLPSFPPYLPNTKLAKNRLKDEVKRRQKMDPTFDKKKFLSDVKSSTVSISGREEMKHYERENKDLKISNFGRYLKAGLSTILVSQRRLHIKPCDVSRTIPVNCGYIGTSDYDIEPGDREFMIRCGYDHTKQFLREYIASKKHKMCSSKSFGGFGSLSSQSMTSSGHPRRTVSSVFQYNSIPRTLSGISQASRETEV